MIYTAIILILSLWGFLLCIKINKKKKKKGPMVCFAGADCAQVVNSKFSSFLGVGLELYGALYYLLIAIAYLVIELITDPIMTSVLFIVMIASGFAFVFSVILTLIQAFVIKNWCSWCLTSAALSTVIFALGFVKFLY